MFVWATERLGQGGRVAASLVHIPAALLLLGGCAAERAATLAVDSQPDAVATVSGTVFRPALACLDGQLAAASPRTTDIVVGFMPDSSGELSVALRDMTINAIAQANTRSGAFRVIDLPPSGDAVYFPGANGLPFPTEGKPKLEATSLHATGSIIAVNRNLYREDGSIGGGVTDAGRIGLSYVSQLSALQTGMRITRFGTNEVLYSSQHHMAIRNSQRGADAVAEIGSIAIGASIGYASQESPAAAVQTLVDLHVIELLGKVAGVPYWTCLDARATDPATQTALSSAWRAMSAAERRARIRTGLRALGYPGSLEQALRRFQIDQGLVASGRPSFETFRALSVALPEGIPAKVPAEPAPSPLGISMRVNYIGPTHRLEVGLERSAHVHCFHRDPDGTISQIFPNPFQRQSWLTANAAHFVPNTIAEKEILIQGSGLQFLCMASEADLSDRLPPAFGGPVFSDLRARGVMDLDMILQAYARAAENNLDFATAISH